MEEVVVCGAVDDVTREQIARLAAAAESHDGAPPLSDDTVLGALPDTVHSLYRDAGRLIGYSAFHPRSGLVELVVDPQWRSQRLGSALLSAAVAQGAQTVWAHGDLPAAQALAAQIGWIPRRRLNCMVRPLGAVVKRPLPPGWQIRSLRPGVDDDALLAVNHAAFVELPDQGQWGPSELAARYRASWFAADDVLLLCDPEGTVVGFHWTKVHPVSDSHPTGEVYVLAVDPARRGRGLGATLLAAGLQHLAVRECDQVILYVDASNTAADRLYQRQGFSVERTDVLYGSGKETADGK